MNLLCVEDGIDSSKDSGKLMISVLSAVAEIERENILVQTMEGRKQKAREGKWNGGFAPYGYELIRAMQLVGINVITRTEVEECFAVIDDEIVWHGGMNLLGKADVWDNLMRIRNSQVATELLEIALGCSEERRKSE